MVVITGASSGTTARFATARRFRPEHGAKLVLGARRLDRLRALAAELSLGDVAAAVHEAMKIAAPVPCTFASMVVFAMSQPEDARRQRDPLPADPNLHRSFRPWSPYRAFVNWPGTAPASRSPARRGAGLPGRDHRPHAPSRRPPAHRHRLHQRRQRRRAACRHPRRARLSSCAAGLTPTAALACATTSPASFLGMARFLGPRSRPGCVRTWSCSTPTPGSTSATRGRLPP